MDINRIVIVAESSELETLLAAHDLQVVWAGPATDAPGPLRSQHPDAVFIDMGTRGLDRATLNAINEQAGRRIILCGPAATEDSSGIEPLATLTAPYSEQKIAALLARLHQTAEPVDPETDLSLSALDLPSLGTEPLEDHHDTNPSQTGDLPDPAHLTPELEPLTLDGHENGDSVQQPLSEPATDSTEARDSDEGNSLSLPPLDLHIDGPPQATADAEGTTATAVSGAMERTAIESIARTTAEAAVEKAALLILHAARNTCTEIAESTAHKIAVQRTADKTQTADDTVLRKAFDELLNSARFEQRLSETVERSVLPVVEERAQVVIQQALRDLDAEQAIRKTLARRTRVALGLAVIALLLSLGAVGAVLAWLL